MNCGICPNCHYNYDEVKYCYVDFFIRQLEYRNIQDLIYYAVKAKEMKYLKMAVDTCYPQYSDRIEKLLILL